MINDDILWLLKFYHDQCDGDWEHGNGVQIGTIDNPGWYLKIELSETNLENIEFEITDINRSENS